MTDMPVLDQLDQRDFEKVVFVSDRRTGLRSIIAIHDTTLGPALGGVRMRPYANEAEALADVLRLARGMTYKASISGVDLGGGKSVILGDPRSIKEQPLLEAFARSIEFMKGEYIAGQDIGTDSRDMAVIRGLTRHVSCVHESAGGAGDPSHVTAFGVTCGIRAVLMSVFGSDEMAGRHVAIQGLGHVGSFVARYCHDAGARLTVTDVAREPIQWALRELGAESVDPGDIYDVDCDVFSPCSVGAVVNDDTLHRLRCRAIAGGANNVLAEPRHGPALADRGIVYAPDYLVNSAGLIRCREEIRGAPTDDERIFKKVSRIYDQTLAVIRTADERGVDTAKAADLMAERRIARVRKNGEAWNVLRNE